MIKDRIDAYKEIWKRNKDMQKKLKSCPAMPDWWRFGYDSKEEMEDDINGCS